MDFLLGTALIVLPRAQQVPLVVATILVKGVQGLGKRRRAKRAVKAADEKADGPQEVTLEWSRLSCSLTNKKDGTKRMLLQDMAGTATPGRLLAIMGPSGSGKTTLLDTLAGQLPYTSGMELRGVITVNGASIEDAEVGRGFVAQQDIFFSMLTVRETLMMQAELRLPGSWSKAQREARVDAVIQRLGLAKASDTIVGDAKKRGLSGGERKRLSIACELISSSRLLFADEPTSGLDSAGAGQVMHSLKDLADDGCTVIASIHQPRSSVFALFDDLMLLSEGVLIYFGPAADALPYFAGLGHACPQHYNPAEYLADLVAVDHSSPEAEAASLARLAQLSQAWAAEAARRGAAAGAAAAAAGIAPRAAGSGVGNGAPACGLGKQLGLLFQRSWRQVTRDRATLVSRAMSQVSSAIVFSSIYWRMGRGQASIQDRMGLLQVSAVGTAMSSLIKTLNVFPRERTIVARERARGGYSLLPYLLSKLAAELPVGAIFPALFGAIVYPTTGLNAKASRFAKFLGILCLESFSAQAMGLAVGAAAPSTEAALAIGPAVILVSIVFGGLFVNEASTPALLKWLPHTSLIKQAFSGMCVNEFAGLTFETGPGQGGEASGEAVLDRLSFGGTSVRGSQVAQGRILAFYYWATYAVLKAKKPRAQELKPPQPEATA